MTELIQKYTRHNRCPCLNDLLRTRQGLPRLAKDVRMVYTSTKPPRSICLILVVALLSQTAGCTATRVVRAIEKESIEGADLQEEMKVVLYLKPTARLENDSWLGRRIVCGIVQVDQNQVRVRVSKRYVRQAVVTIRIIESVVLFKDIQRIEILEIQQSTQGSNLLLLGSLGLVALFFVLHLLERAVYPIPF